MNVGSIGYRMLKLLKLSFDHLIMFKDGKLTIDLYAQDKVFKDDESVTLLQKPLYSENVIALAGINASGKSVALSLIDLALRIVGGEHIELKGYDRGLSNVFEGGETSMNALIWNGGALQLLRSEIVVSGDYLDESHGAGELKFGEETVLAISLSGFSKERLAHSFDEIAKLGHEALRRSALGSAESRFLKDDVSVFSALSGGGVSHLYYEAADFPLSLSAGFEGLDDVLRTFDAGIEHLEVADGGRAFRLKLANQDTPLTLSRDGLEDVLSSGTAKGLMLVQRSIMVLKTGGYLLLDEIENHLNRRLVNVIIDLFCTKQTNPHGATLVFTTHYPEVLDHIHRKDNVYFLVRGNDFRSEAVKYSSRVKRIENKKSEVFASNYIDGTAPNYSVVKALRDYAEKAVGEDEHDR